MAHEGWDIDTWNKHIKRGLDYKQKWGEAKRWHLFRRYYRGEFPTLKATIEDPLVYNLIYAMGRTIVPNVYFRNPYINVTPRYKADVGPAESFLRQIQARVVEATDNWLIQEMNLKRTAKMMVLDAFLCGVSFAKIGYDSQYGWSEKDVASDLGVKDATLTQLDKKQTRRIEYDVNVKAGFPWVARVMPDNIIVPFGTHVLNDCPWIDHIVLRPLDDVQADTKYKNTKELMGTHADILFKDERKNFYRQLTGDAEWVEIHELRDARFRKVLALVPGHEFFLRDEDDELQIEGLPYVALSFNDDPEHLWAVSDVSLIEPQQLEMNEARTQAAYHRRIALLKFLYQEGMIEPAELDKLLRGEVGMAVKVKGAPGAAVASLQPHIPPDLLAWVEAIRGDVRETLGAGRNQMGEVQASSRRTATEAQIVQMAHELRLDERRDAMADCVCEIMRKVNQVIFKFWDVERIAQVVGLEGARYWIKYTPSELKAEYDLKVDVESMVPTTKALKRNEIVQILGMLAKQPGANVDYLLRLLLKEFDWADTMAILPQAPQAGPMPVQEFAGRQQAMARSPQRRQEATRRTAQTVAGGRKEVPA